MVLAHLAKWMTPSKLWSKLRSECQENVKFDVLLTLSLPLWSELKVSWKWVEPNTTISHQENAKWMSSELEVSWIGTNGCVSGFIFSIKSFLPSCLRRSIETCRLPRRRASTARTYFSLSLSLSLSTFGKNDTNFLEEIHSAARYKATGRGRGSQIAMGQRRDRARDEIERERCPPLEFSDSVLSFHDWKRSPNCRNWTRPSRIKNERGWTEVQNENWAHGREHQVQVPLDRVVRRIDRAMPWGDFNLKTKQWTPLHCV